MEVKKLNILKCWLRTFVAYAAISFAWLAFMSIGMSAAEEAASAKVDYILLTNAAFASNLITQNAVIAVFSAIYGFSSLLFSIRNMSGAAKRSLHILINYVAAVITVLILHSSAKESEPKDWIILVFLATFLFFAVYGIGALIEHFIKKSQ